MWIDHRRIYASTYTFMLEQDYLPNSTTYKWDDVPHSPITDQMKMAPAHLMGSLFWAYGRQISMFWGTSKCVLMHSIFRLCLCKAFFTDNENGYQEQVIFHRVHVKSLSIFYFKGKALFVIFAQSRFGHSASFHLKIFCLTKQQKVSLQEN